MIDVEQRVGTQVMHERGCVIQEKRDLGDSNYVRVQILTPAGVLDRGKQLGQVKEMTGIIAAAAGDPGLVERTWVLITEAPDGGWGIDGHAYTGVDIAEAARRELTGS
jgi:phenylpyruvate tautomerase PptA (4-oxalocrotonate tautomerase family)